MDEENLIKIYSEDNILYLIKNNINYSFNKRTKQLDELEEYNPSMNTKEFKVYSIIGTIKAKTNSYIICSLSVINIGKILEANIFKIKKFTYIPIEGNNILSEDVKYLKMLDDFLLRNNLYYSDKLDLTLSLINMNKIKENETTNIPINSFIFTNTISKYCWNYNIGKYFDVDDMNNFIFPVINGFLDIKKGKNLSEEFDFILIGRKDTKRSGVRFLIRGADEEGNVANSSENEEIIIYKDKENNINIASFVQIRGSIPLIWKQEPSLKLNPQIRPRNDFDVNSAVFKLHFDEILNTYNSVCCINLVDQKKDQKIIGDYYSNLIQNYKDKNKNISNKVDFAWFDFHAECKKLKYENIKKLFKKNSVHKCLNSYGYTHIKFSEYFLQQIPENEKIDKYLLKNENIQNIEIIELQKGVFRTNCIDSLDRSNVVQSTFARYFLFKILHELDLSHKQPSGDDVFQKFENDFEKIFKIIWADHGDGLSLPYSGTGAMKSDFVRTGKRTYMGNLQDGIISLTRFYINNFRDGYYQDCNDYFLGKLNPKFDNFKNHSLFNIKIILTIACFISTYIYSFAKRISLSDEYNFSLSRLLFKGILFLACYFFTLVVISTFSLNSFIDLHSKHE